MKMSRGKLEALILEELKEALEYPASELTQITATIWKLADSLGIETSGNERQRMVDELESLLNAQGFELHEQRLMLGQPLDISLEGTSLYGLMQRIAQADPSAWNKILAAFERGGIGTGLQPASGAPPADDKEDQTDTIVVPPVDGPPEELQVGDIIDVSDKFGTKASKKHFLHKVLKPGTSYRVASIDDGEDEPLRIVNVETERMMSGLRHADFLDYPEFFTVRQADDEELTQTVVVPPVDPPEDEGEDGTETIVVPPVDPPDDEEEEEPFENPWAFKWFWEKGAVEDFQDDREDSEFIRNLKSVPTAKDVTIGTIVALGGAAGLYALWKYLFGVENDEELPPGLAQSAGKQAQDLEELDRLRRRTTGPQFLWSAIKWVLSLALDEGQMEWVNRIEPLVRMLSQQDITPEALSSLLDDVPGIELIDKLPGGREKVVELMMDKWEIMDQKERVDLILMLAPEEYLEMLDQVLNTSPAIGEIPGLDFPGVKTALYNWIDEGDLAPGGPYGFGETPLWGFMILAGARLGLIDTETAVDLVGVIHDVEDSLAESKEDGKVKRGMKLMKMLLQEQQLNRMKVLAGVR